MLSAAWSSLPLGAQAFGQWWWDGQLSYEDADRESETGSEESQKYEESRLRVSLGLNGFLGHPALGSFRVGVEALGSGYRSRFGLDSETLGYSLDLSLLPEGKAPTTIELRRSDFEYTLSDEAPRGLLSRRPATQTWANSQVRILSGALQGLSFGGRWLEVAPVDQQFGSDRRNSLTADWVRPIGATRNRLRTRWQKDELGERDFASEYRLLSFDQSARISPHWGSNFWVNGQRRTTRYTDDGAQSQDELRGQVLLRRDGELGSYLEFRADGASTKSDSSSTSSGYSSSLSYRWRLAAGTEITPYLQYSSLSSDASSASNARAGLSLSWSRSGRRFGTALRASGAYGRFTSDEIQIAPTNTDLSYTFSGQAFAGSGRGRAEVEAEWGRREFRLAEGNTTESLEAEVIRGVIGLDDFVRGLVRLSIRGLRGHVALTSEISQRKTAPLVTEDRSEFETSRNALEVGWGALSIVAGSGTTELRSRAAPEQSVDYDTLSMNWKLHRSLSLVALYRSDHRQFDVEPDIDFERSEVGAFFSMGYLRISLEAYEAREGLTRGVVRRDTGLKWSIRRDLAGWLPIATGDRRRGVIR